MKIVYTSGLGTQNSDKRLRDENGFVDMLRVTLSGMSKLMVIANRWQSEKPVGLSLDDEFDNSKTTNFEFAKRIKAWYKASNMEFKEVVLIDENYEGNIKKDIESSDMIIVEGGDALRGIEVLEKISFKENIKDFTGILLLSGASAKILSNKVLCATSGNGVNYEEHDGLNLVDYAVRPHFNYSLKWNFNKNGRNSLKQLKDFSNSQPIFAIDFDTYLFDDGSNVVAYGKCYSFKNGKMKKECSDDNFQLLK